MDRNGNWLCPTELHRARLLEMEAKLGAPRAIMYGALGLAFLVSIPWVGIWPLIPLAGVVILYAALRPYFARAARPEYLIFATVVNAQVLIGVGIALSGGPRSPAIPMLLLPLITLPARFSSRGVYAGLGISVAVLLACTVAVDPVRFAQDPTYALAGLASAAGLTAFANTLMRTELKQRSDAVLDPLTGLLNRNALATRFEEIAQQAALTDGWVCLLVCDLDRFKEVNDVHGHERGDAVLREVADVLRTHLRSFELVYRLGGEEFLVVLPGSTLDVGRAIAERLRSMLEAARPAGLQVTGSIGVAAARGARVAFDGLFRAADAALYEGKRAGRNRVVTAREARSEVAPFANA